MSDSGASSDDDSAYSDTYSCASDVSYTDTIVASDESSETVVVDFEERLLDALDRVSEKRASTRVAALKTMMKLMRSRVCTRYFLERSTTSVYKLLTCIRRGGTADSVLAAKVLEILILTLGADNEGIFEDCRKALFPIIQTGRKVPTRAACVRTMGMACFVASIERSSTMACMSLFQDIIKLAAAKLQDEDDGDNDEKPKRRKKRSSRKDTLQVTVEALKAWGLLATTRTPDYLGCEGFKTMIPFFYALLNHDSYDIRCAAGQNAAHLAQYYFRRSKIHKDDDDKDEVVMVEGDDDDDDDGASRREKTVNIRDMMKEMSAALKEMSIENHRYKKKKELKKQRSFFRALYQTMETGESPVIKLSLRGGEKIFLDTWTSIKRLEAFRETLGGGVNVFFRTSQLVRDVFQLGPVRHEAAERLSKIEKRLYRSPNSEDAKMRTLNRAKERRMKGRRMQGY